MWKVGVMVPRDHWHLLRRIYERWGIVLEPGEFTSAIKRPIGNKEAPCFLTAEDNVAHHIVLRGERIIVVTTPWTEQGNIRFITALPFRAHERLQRTKKDRIPKHRRKKRSSR